MYADHSLYNSFLDNRQHGIGLCYLEVVSKANATQTWKSAVVSYSSCLWHFSLLVGVGHACVTLHALCGSGGTSVHPAQLHFGNQLLRIKMQASLWRLPEGWSVAPAS